MDMVFSPGGNVEGGLATMIEAARLRVKWKTGGAVAHSTAGRMFSWFSSTSYPC
jgi:hypothetical protein